MRRRISIRGRVRPSVGPSVRPVLFSKVKSRHTTRRILCRVSGLVFPVPDLESFRRMKVVLIAIVIVVLVIIVIAFTAVASE